MQRSPRGPARSVAVAEVGDDGALGERRLPSAACATEIAAGHDNTTE